MQNTCRNNGSMSTASSFRSAQTGALALAAHRPAASGASGKPALRAALYEFCFGNWVAGDAMVDNRLLYDAAETDLERFARDLGYQD